MACPFPLLSLRSLAYWLMPAFCSFWVVWAFWGFVSLGCPCLADGLVYGKGRRCSDHLVGGQSRGPCAGWLGQEGDAQRRVRDNQDPELESPRAHLGPLWSPPGQKQAGRFLEVNARNLTLKQSILAMACYGGSEPKHSRGILRWLAQWSNLW